MLHSFPTRRSSDLSLVSPSQLFEQVVQVAPSFDTVLRSHMELNKQLLPHLLIADLLRFLQSTFSGSLCDGAVPPTIAEIEGAFRVLDMGLSDGDDHTLNAI